MTDLEAAEAPVSVPALAPAPPATVEVLGIDVHRTLLRRWGGWLAPARQPFFLTASEATELGLTTEPSRDLSPELRDTYEVWNVAEKPDVVWLDEDAFHALPGHVRAELVRAQARHGLADLVRLAPPGLTLHRHSLR